MSPFITIKVPGSMLEKCILSAAAIEQNIAATFGAFVVFTVTQDHFEVWSDLPLCQHKVMAANVDSYLAEVRP